MLDQATLLFDFEIITGIAGLMLAGMIYLFYFKYPYNKDVE